MGPCCGVAWTGPFCKGVPAFCSKGMELFTTEGLLVEATASSKDVTIKTTAEAVVSLPRSVEAPRLPKRVWLEPPKAAPSSAPLLL